MLENNKGQLQIGRSRKAFLSKWLVKLGPKGEEGVSHLTRIFRERTSCGKMPKKKRVSHISVNIENIGGWNIINKVKSCEEKRLGK